MRRIFFEIGNSFRRGWTLFAAMTGVCYAILALVSVYPTTIFERPQDVPIAVMLLVLVALTYATIFIVLYQQDRLFRTQERQGILEAQAVMMSRRVEDILRAEEAMRIERHDMRHQLQTVASLARKGDCAAILDYIGTSRERLDSIAPKRYCANPVLDAVLANAAAQAERLSITLEIAVTLPAKLPADVLELSIVFANALENAVQAVRELPDGQRHIVCKSVAYPRFMIEISNPYRGEIVLNQQGVPITDKPGHGTGTRSIVAFTEKYNAQCVFRAENGWFKLLIAL